MITDEAFSRLFLVSGRVQGVGFRYATAEKARELGLTGHVRNLPDGRVEVFACGAATTLHELREWLDEGPPLARVREVASEEASPAPAPDDFAIR